MTAAWIWVPWAVALVVLTPTSARLDRRLALNVAAAVGLVPVVTWLPPVLGPRTAAIAALALGTVVALGLWRSRSTELVPSVRRRDSLILVAAVVAGAVAFPLRDPGTAERALAMLSTSIDNSYHFAMFLEQRLMAVGSPLIAANADASGFAFGHHPQGFHRMLTVLAQVGFGDPGDATTELVRYAQLQWLVFVVTAVLVTAAFLQAIPDLTPPSLLIPSLAIVWSLVLGVPGALNLLQGHLSFLVAACAPLVIFLLARTRRRLTPAVVVALLGLVLVAASWMLLLPLAGAALVPTVVATWRRQGPVARWTSLVVAAIGATIGFAVFVSPWLFGAGLQAVVRDGTVPRVGLPAMVPLLIGPVALLMVVRRRQAGPDLGAHLLMSIVSLAQMVVLGGYLLLATGELTYYFWKLGLASLLVSIVVTVHALVTVRIAAADARERSGAIRPLAALVLTLLAAVGLGSVLQQFTAPSAAWAAIMPVSMSARATSGDAGDVAVVLALAERWSPGEAARVRLLATRPSDMNAAHASEWFHALSHSATRDAVNVDDPVYTLAEDPGNVDLAVEIASRALEQPDQQVVITDTGLHRAVVASVTPAQAERVTLVSDLSPGE